MIGLKIGDRRITYLSLKFGTKSLKALLVLVWYLLWLSSMYFDRFTVSEVYLLSWQVASLFLRQVLDFPRRIFVKRR
jgi:hypothetical protein